MGTLYRSSASPSLDAASVKRRAGSKAIPLLTNSMVPQCIPRIGFSTDGLKPISHGFLRRRRARKRKQFAVVNRRTDSDQCEIDRTILVSGLAEDRSSWPESPPKVQLKSLVFGEKCSPQRRIGVGIDRVLSDESLVTQSLEPSPAWVEWCLPSSLTHANAPRF